MSIQKPKMLIIPEAYPKLNSIIISYFKIKNTEKRNDSFFGIYLQNFNIMEDI